MVTDFTKVDYNSYATVADMDKAMATAEILGGTVGWGKLPAPSKEAYITNASLWINTLNWDGDKDTRITAPGMVLPRTGSDYINGVIPEAALAAMACYIVAWIKTGGNTSGKASAGVIGAVESKDVGGVKVKYNTGNTTAAPAAVATESQEDACAKKYLAQYVTVAYESAIGGVGLRRAL